MTKDSSQIRIRSKVELEERGRVMLEVASLFDKNNINFFICLGALLGIVRDHYFIPWDWDIEFGVITDEVYSRREEIERLLKESGYQILNHDFHVENFKIDFAKDDPEASSYTLVGWCKSDGFWKRNLLRIPEIYFNTFDELEFLGRRFKCPHNPEGYLEYQYGKDWRTPKRTNDPDTYWNSAAFPLATVEGAGGYGGYIKRKLHKVFMKFKSRWTKK